MNVGHKAFMKLEVAMLSIAAVPALIYLFTAGVPQAVKTLLVCFLVPQPFLIYAFKEWLWGSKGDGDK